MCLLLSCERVGYDVPMRTATLPAVLFFATAASAAPDFDRQIAPLLAARCAACHSGDDAKGDLDLTRKAAVVGKAVVPGKLADSSLWQRVEAGEMPPKGGLPAAEKALLKEWIASGAGWGTDPIDPYSVTTSTRAGCIAASGAGSLCASLRGTASRRIRSPSLGARWREGMRKSASTPLSL